MKHVYLLALTLCTLLLCVAADLAPALQLGTGSPFFPKQDSIIVKPAPTGSTCNCTKGDLIFSLDSCRYHFGLITGNSEQIHLTFYAKNTGTSPVIITNATTSCGCDVPTWPKAPILPGQSASFTYTYDSKRQGPFTKTMAIAYNQNIQVLVMDGRVEAADNAPTGNAFAGTQHFEKDF